MWILSLLADGTRTDADFALSARTHCPSLVLALLGSMAGAADAQCQRLVPEVLIAAANTPHGAGHLINTYVLQCQCYYFFSFFFFTFIHKR